MLSIGIQCIHIDHMKQLKKYHTKSHPLCIVTQQLKGIKYSPDIGYIDHWGSTKDTELCLLEIGRPVWD